VFLDPEGTFESDDDEDTRGFVGTADYDVVDSDDEC